MGFHNSLAIPRREANLATLVQALHDYLVAHPAQENAPLNVTAARANELIGLLGTARGAVDTQEGLNVGKRQDRDKKVVTLRRRLSGLCKELGQRLEPLDPRWRDFGLNMPGAASVPSVPQEVMVLPLPGAQVQVACLPSSNAALYRFFTQRPDLDPQPVFGRARAGAALCHSGAHGRAALRSVRVGRQRGRGKRVERARTDRGQRGPGGVGRPAAGVEPPSAKE